MSDAPPISKSESFHNALLQALVVRITEVSDPAALKAACRQAQDESERQICRTRLAIDEATFHKLAAWKPTDPPVSLPPSPYLKCHPLANSVPMLTAERLSELAQDVQAAGITRPIDLYEGKILDGRNRYVVSIFLRITAPTNEYTGQTPAAHVLRENLLRRDLTTSQRAMAVAVLMPKFEAEAKRRLRMSNETKASLPDSEKGQAREHAAALANVSARSVESARKVVKSGVPGLQEAVTQGKVAVSAAAKVATLPPDEQAAIVSQGSEAIKAKSLEMQSAAPSSPEPPTLPPKPKDSTPPAMPSMAEGQPRTLLDEFFNRYSLQRAPESAATSFSAETTMESATLFQNALKQFEQAKKDKMAVFIIALEGPTGDQSSPLGRTAAEVTDPTEMEKIYKAYKKYGGKYTFEQIERLPEFNLRPAHGNTALRVIQKFEKIMRKESSSHGGTISNV